MKIVVTHMSPDWDAISSVWLIKKYLAGWQDADVQFVPAGTRAGGDIHETIERLGDNEVIHVDTGLGPLDHHQIQDTSVSAVSRTWDYVQEQLKQNGDTLTPIHVEAVSRIVAVIVALDHFKEVFWENPASDHYEFSLYGVLEGLKFVRQEHDKDYVTFGIQCLDALVAQFENRIWAEKEIAEKGIKFETSYGPGMGFETLNDTVLKLAQKMGYVVVVRKDPRKGYVRIKALPEDGKKKGVDLTLAYEQLRKIDPDATWFLHISKKMLLNGTPKNPKIKPSTLNVRDIIKVLERI